MIASDSDSESNGVIMFAITGGNETVYNDGIQ